LKIEADKGFSDPKTLALEPEKLYFGKVFERKNWVLGVCTVNKRFGKSSDRWNPEKKGFSAGKTCF
jgi:hypothetical protein